MKVTEDARKYAAEQAISEEEALKKGMEEKSKEFVEKGAEVYAKAQALVYLDGLLECHDPRH